MNRSKLRDVIVKSLYQVYIYKEKNIDYKVEDVPLSRWAKLGFKQTFTSIFNAGASVGALAAPVSIPPLAEKLGWEWAFVIIGGLGFIWMALWVFIDDKPNKSKHVNDAELT